MGNEGLVVLSLFDGMSCGQLALQRLGIKVKQYYAAEIDKYAIKVTQSNFPNTIQLGDVTNVFAKDLPKIDLLIGGSPCQGFSFAGKQLAFDDPRSKLFFEFVRLKNECNPKYFLLENVKMKKEFEIIISKYMGISPIEINSDLVSAQNRVRLYWTNIASKPYGLFGDMQCIIPQPKDKGFILKDILETEVDEKYFLSKVMLKNVKIWKDNGNGVVGHSGTGGQKGIIFNTTNKVGSLCATDYKQPKQIINNKRLEKMIKENEITDGCLIDSYNKKILTEKSMTITTRVSASNLTHIYQDKMIRKLTPVECERLQTVPDNYTNYVSDSQRYRMLGNGWTIDVIAHILSYM